MSQHKVEPEEPNNGSHKRQTKKPKSDTLKTGKRSQVSCYTNETPGVLQDSPSPTSRTDDAQAMAGDTGNAVSSIKYVTNTDTDPTDNGNEETEGMSPSENSVGERTECEIQEPVQYQNYMSEQEPDEISLSAVSTRDIIVNEASKMKKVQFVHWFLLGSVILVSVIVAVIVIATHSKNT